MVSVAISRLCSGFETIASSRVLMRVLLSLLLAASFSAAQDSESDRARQLLISGKAADAAKIYRDLSRAQPGNPDLLLNLSIAEYKAGNFQASADSAAAALKLAPDLLPARLFLGASYLELGSYAEAVDPLNSVVTRNPRDRNARLMLAEALLGAGRPADAIDHFRASTEALPENPRVWSGLARAYEATLRWREASNQWKEALKLTPKDTKIRVGLAWAEFRSRDYESAIATLTPMLSSTPTAEVQFLYGASLLNLQKPTEALPYIETALTLDAKFLPARAAMGQALLQTGKADKAIPLLKDALSIDHDGSTHFQLFRAYQLTNREDEAKQALAAYQRLRASAH
jgi:predicted Zn-dependent protease